MTTTTDSTTTPPPPPTRPRLERSRDDRYVAGVCGGLGRYFDIDPVIVRVVVACMAVFGAGLLVYAAAWILVPEQGTDASIAQSMGRDHSHGRELAVIVLVVIAGLAAIDGVFGGGGGDGEWIVPLVIIGGSLWWWHRGQEQRAGIPHGMPGTHAPHGMPAWPTQPVHTNAPPETPPAPSAFWAATATTQPAGTPTVPLSGPPGGMPWTVPAWTAASRPPRERSRLGFLTFSAVLVAVGVAALLDAMNAIDLTVTIVLATALVVVGAGLLLGAWVGRSRGLIALGLILTGAVSVSAAIDVPLRGTSGDRTWVVASTADLASEYSIRAGTGLLDLRTVEFADGPRQIDVNVGLGNLDIVVPDGVEVRVVGHISIGSTTIFGHVRDEFDADFDHAPAGAPQLVINARIGLGELEVRHASA